VRANTGRRNFLRLEFLFEFQVAFVTHIAHFFFGERGLLDFTVRSVKPCRRNAILTIHDLDFDTRAFLNAWACPSMVPKDSIFVWLR
jgi:hypothetical protein